MKNLSKIFFRIDNYNQKVQNNARKHRIIKLLFYIIFSFALLKMKTKKGIFMFWDTHLHCNFSGDSSSRPQDMAEAAAARGLPGICFTDHLDYDYPPDPGLFLFDPAIYEKEIKKLQKQYAGRLEILHGIELGLQPHLAKRHRQLLADCAFDFVIGSSHVVHGMDPYYAAYYDGRTEEEAYLEYFTSILENIRAFHAFDVYGHIDYVVRYGPNKNAHYTYEKFRAVLDDILKLLISLGKGIEVNTAGFKYGLGHPNPCEEILKRYHALGGEILTVGADAHEPRHVGYDFPKLPALLRSCGFSYYTVFKNRRPEFIPIP